MERLEACSGSPEAGWPLDPYLFLVWQHCGYPASDAACEKGWNSLLAEIGVEPTHLLQAGIAELTQALKPGGMVPELRALRLKEIAERVEREFNGRLAESLKAMPIAKARAALKKFPSIADPGADRILLFADLSPAPAVPSNCPHVLVRIQRGLERENYGRTYKEAQESIEAEIPPVFAARRRAYLLLKRHGQEICKRANPRCEKCPVSGMCAYKAGKMRGRAPGFGQR